VRAWMLAHPDGTTDHASLPLRDRLVLRRPEAGNPFGEKLAALIEARGWPLRDVARRALCNAGYLSNVIHGRRRASGQMAGRLDDVPGAEGALAVLAGTQSGDGQAVIREDPPARAPGTAAVSRPGASLALPCVLARFVIEFSRPDTETRPDAGSGLALVTPQSGRGA
jgi:hypothetical protein